MAEKRGLGRGLSALIGDVATEAAQGDAAGTARPDKAVAIERLKPNPNQPRHDFDPDELGSLADSIREKGILQPLIVRPSGDGGYQIVAGERRWRAAQLAQVHEVPVLVRDYSDEEVLEIAIIENIQRADLNPVEEARGYRQLMDTFGHTQEQLAQGLSKSRSHIANQLRLLSLPDEVLDMLRQGQLTAGHARALITAPDPLGLARQVVARGLSVRETEKLTRKAAHPAPKAAPRKLEKDADTLALENDLSATLGMKVAIAHGEGGTGQLTVRYGSLDELDEICQLLSRVERMAH